MTNDTDIQARDIAARLSSKLAVEICAIDHRGVFCPSRVEKALAKLGLVMIGDEPGLFGHISIVRTQLGHAVAAVLAEGMVGK